MKNRARIADRRTTERRKEEEEEEEEEAATADADEAEEDTDSWRKNDDATAHYRKVALPSGESRRSADAPRHLYFGTRLGLFTLSVMARTSA